MLHYKSLPSHIISICLFSEHSALFSPWIVDALLVLKDKDILRLTSIMQKLLTLLGCRSILYFLLEVGQCILGITKEQKA